MTTTDEADAGQLPYEVLLSGTNSTVVGITEIAPPPSRLTRTTYGESSCCTVPHIALRNLTTPQGEDKLAGQDVFGHAFKATGDLRTEHGFLAI